MAVAETPSPYLRAYELLSGNAADARLCTSIPEAACHHQPRNFVLNVGNGAATKLAEQLASPELVLPWMLAALGAPAVLAGALVPVKQAGSLLPQLAVAAAIRHLNLRKWAWAVAAMIQATMLMLMIPAALLLPPAAAGGTIVVLLLLFSVASGAGSVAFQDVVGKTVAKGLRGRMLAMRAAIGGGLTLVAAAVLRFEVEGEVAIGFYLVLIGTAAALWMLAAVLFAAITEQPGATAGGRNALGEARRGLAVARRVPGFRRFLWARAALLSVELAAPFYALHAYRLFDGAGAALGLFVFAIGAANVASSPLWGTFADRSSRLVMAASGLVGAAAAALALLVPLLPAAWQSPYLYMPVFLLVGLAVSGVRLGRKTYLIDGAPAEERPLYVAFSNTAIGVLTLAAGAAGLVADAFGVVVMVSLLGILALVAAWAAWRLPEAARMAEPG